MMSVQPIEASPTPPPPSVQEKKYVFHLSPSGARKVYEQLKKRGTPNAALRVGVRGGGCSGFSYVLEFTDKPARSRDLIFTFAVDRKANDTEEPGEVRIYCDKKSILYLNGSTLTWEKKLMWRGFKFLNPHEKSSCGCNESFTV